MWNEAVEVIEATEAVEAVEVIEATDISRPGKSLLSTPESSRLLNLVLFWCFENHFFSWIMKYHFSIFAHFLLEAVEASLGYFFKNWFIKMPTSQDFKTTFKCILTCIFLSLRAELLFNLCYEIPCNGQPSVVWN